MGVKQVLRRCIIALLVFTGLSACAGGAVLIADPTGSLIKMPLSLLQYTPFSSFLIPGVILFLLVGVSSLVITYCVVKLIKLYPLWVIAQGACLVIWIVTQMIMIRGVSILHFIYGGTGMLLIILGIMIIKRK